MATVTSSKRQLTHTSNTYESNGDVTIGGNLNINGTTTTIDTANLLVEDKNIIIGDVSSPTDSTADGGGITLKGASDKTINWVNSTDSWTSNQNFSAPSLTLTGLSNQSSEATVLVVNGSNVVGTRELGSNAFNSTSFLTGNQTITLSGDVSGSGTTSISVTVADDSHNHVISNVDGLQSALDGKLGSSEKAADSNLLDGINSSSFLRSDATDTATGALTLSNLNNHYQGHHYFDPYNSTGLHYPHYLNGSSGEAKVNVRVYNAGGGSYDLLYFAAGDNNMTWRGNKIWNAGNDGSGSGLDADKLDAQEGSYYRNATNLNAGTVAAARLSTATTQASSENSTKIATTAYVKSQGYLTSLGNALLKTGGTMTGAINTNGSNIIVNGGTGLSTTGNETKFTTAHGYIELGPKNSSHAHIYTGSPNFYFNKELLVNGSRVFHDTYHPNADTLTTARTITLAGDVTGNVSFNGSSNVSITTVVGNDSHTHDSRYYTESESDTRFLRADADDSITNSLTIDQVNGGNLCYNLANNGVYIPHPKGASYHTTGNSHTGAIAIKFPTASQSSYDMLSFHVDIFDYANGPAGESVSLFVFGYINGPNSWVNTGAHVISDRTDRDYTVRFATASDRHVVYIGETTSTWNYLQIVVRDFQAGYSADHTHYNEGWDIDVNVTSFETIRQTASDNYPVSKRFKTARNIALTGAVTGNANFDGSANISIATTATADPTLTLSGDASGSATFTNLGNATLSVAVANNSHTHTIANITSLQSSLDAKAALASPALTGNPTAPTQAANNNSTRIATTAYVQTEIGDLIGGAPAALDTLNELAAAIGDDASYASSITTALAGKQVAGTYNTIIGTDSDINTSGATVVDQLNMTDGVIQSHSTRTLTLANLGYTGATNANNYSLPAGSSSTRGGFKIGFSESGKYYPVEVSSEKMYVNVPWTDTNTNTTYSAGTGITLSSTTFSLTDTASKLNLSGGTLTGTLNSRDIKLASGYHLQRSNHHSGHLEGSYNNVGDNGAKSNPIYTIGTNYNPNDANLGNMYGIGYCHATTASFISMTGASGWGMYVAADGDARVFLDGANGTIASTGQHYVGSNVVWNAGNDGSGSGLDADKLDGLHLHTGRNNEANKVVRTDGNGYIQAGWINTTSGANTTQTISRIYASQDGYIRYYTPANFGAQIGSHISYNDLTNKPTIPSAYSLPLSSSSTRGGVKIGFAESGKNYPVELDSSEKMFVNVPWVDTDTNTTYSVGDGGLTQKNFTSTLKTKLDGIATSANNYSLPLSTSSTRGGVKVGFTESGKNYPVELDSSEKMFVNVPWVDTDTNTNTTYSAGTGLSLSGTTFSITDTISSSASNNTIVKRHASGYIFANYFNTTPNTVSSGITQICVETGNDGYIRHGTAAAVRSFINVASGANNYSLPEATATARGGIELFSNTDQSVAANSVSSTASRTYGIQLNSAGQAVVNVPWVDTNTDTNTTYTAGRGLDLSGTEFQLETDLRDSISYIGYDSNDYVQWSNNSYFRSVVNGSERFRVNTSGIDVTGSATANFFRTDTGNTDYSSLTRNSANNAVLYVQSANTNTNQPIAYFSYGSTTAAGGDKVLVVRKDNTYFTNTKVGVGITSPSTALHVIGTITHTIYNATSLPSASPAGQRAFAYSYYPLATSHGSVVSTNGSYVIPVYSDGSSWRAG